MLLRFQRPQIPTFTSLKCTSPSSYLFKSAVGVLMNSPRHRVTLSLSLKLLHLKFIKGALLFGIHKGNRAPLKTILCAEKPPEIICLSSVIASG